MKAESPAPPTVCDEAARPGAGGEELPLSYAQERLWLFSQAAGGALNLPCAIILDGALKLGALEQAFRRVIARRDILRTRFVAVDGRMAQQLVPVPHFYLSLIDLRRLPERERETVARGLIAEEQGRRFELERPPLLRAYVFRLNPRRHVLVFNLNHMVVDEWSMHLLTHEVASAYSDFAGGAPAALAEPPAQYGDFAVRERRALEGETLSRKLEFWKQYLDGLPPLLSLPPARPRPANRTYEGAWLSHTLPEPLAVELKRLAREEGVTLFVVLLAAVSVLLSRYTDADDVAVGTPVTSRSHLSFERMIGPALNTVVLRADCSGRPTFRELLRRVREGTLAALAHAEVPFELLVETLRPARDASYNPLVQVLFVFRRNYGATARLRGLEADPIELHPAATPFDLTLTVADGGPRLHCAFHYNTALFLLDTVRRLSTHLERLLAEIVSRPDARISELELLSDEERHEQVGAWNQTAAPLRDGECAHDLFLQTAARRPDAVAVADGERQLTYAALERASRRLAARLRLLPLETEERVGVCLERSVEMVRGLLGVMRSGAAYVPLDAGQPAERLRRIISDAGIRYVLTQSSLRARLSALGVRLLCVEDDESGVPAHGRGLPAVSDRSLCYVIYTSGSTGEPKGVAVEHRAVVNLLRSMSASPGLGEADTLLAVTPLTFDIAGLELYLPLATGARLFVAPEGASADGFLLRELLRREGATAMQATPFTWRLLLDAGWGGGAGLKVLCGGEALPEELAAALIAATGHVWNCYGPTETTIWSTVRRLCAEDEGVNIGRPIANTQVYLLDRSLQPAPLGVVGELHIGGAGLARGYWGRPAQTARAYLPNPFGGEPGVRMFRTRDLARFLPDGRIVCLGRTDQQVKLRGFRVETGAVSSVLAAHPWVREAVTVLREDGIRGRYLAAYVETEHEARALGHELRRYLRRKLPGYMMPSAFVALGRLPRTPNNKLDRKALPEPDACHFFSAGAQAAPRTPAEKRLAGIWREVLGLTAVGVEDDFFELGGNSLQATRILLKVREEFGVELPLQSFLSAPTVAHVAGRLERGDGGARSEPHIKRVPRDRRLPLSPQQEWWWFHEQVITGIAPNLMQYAVRLDGPLNLPAFEQSLAALFRRHEALRTSIQIHEGALAQVIMPAAEVRPRVRVVDLSNLPAPLPESLIKEQGYEDSETPFDLTRGPLCRVVVFRHAAERYVALFTAHHLVGDGWSTDLFARDLSKLYRAFTAGRPSRLPELAIQYADYAHWQRQWLTTDDFAPHLSYWIRQLMPPLEPLFTDAPGAEPTYEMAGEGFEIPERTARQIRRMSRAAGCTFFATILAGLKLVLHAHSGQADVRVATLTANRSRPGTEEVMGLFTNPAVLRTDVGRARTFRELMFVVQEVVFDAYAHQDMPFDVLAHALQLSLQVKRKSLFDVMVIWQGVPAETLDLPQVKARLYERAVPSENVEIPTAMKLIFDMQETPAQINGEVTYKVCHFSGGRIQKLLRDLNACLRMAAEDPDRTLANMLAALG